MNKSELDRNRLNLFARFLGQLQETSGRDKNKNTACLLIEPDDVHGL